MEENIDSFHYASDKLKNDIEVVSSVIQHSNRISIK